MVVCIIASAIILFIIAFWLTNGKLEDLKERENAAVFLAILAIVISVNIQVGKFGLKRFVDRWQKK